MFGPILSNDILVTVKFSPALPAISIPSRVRVYIDPATKGLISSDNNSGWLPEVSIELLKLIILGWEGSSTPPVLTQVNFPSFKGSLKL